MSHKKHQPGCPCCADCYAVQPEDLPDVTITGYSMLSDWFGGECCKCTSFAKDTANYAESCSGIFATVQETLDYEWQELFRTTPRPLVFVWPSTPTFGLDDCYGVPFSVADHVFQRVVRHDWKLFLRWTPSSISVCVSKQTVTCGADPPVEKWVVLSTMTISYELYAVRGRYKRDTHTVTKTGGACFEEDPSGFCGSDCEHTEEPPCTFGDFTEYPIGGLAGQQSNWCIISSGTWAVQRVKLYDDLPTGTVTFTNSDTPEACSWGLCETNPNYETQLCLSLSNWNGCVSNCICKVDLQPVVEEQVTPDQPFNCDACIPPSTGRLVSYVFSGLCEEAPSVICVPCSGEEPDCPGFARNCIDNYIEVYDPDDPANALCGTLVSATESWYDSFSWGSSFIAACPVMFTVVPSTIPEAGFIGCGPDACYKNVECGLSSCDETCCWEVTCDGGTIVCSPRHQHIGANYTLADNTRECYLNPTSLCINAPSWSVTFS